MRQDISWTVCYCGTEALPIVTRLHETGLFSPTQAHRAVFQLWTQLMFPPTRALTSVTSIALMCDTNQRLRVYRWHSQHCHQPQTKVVPWHQQWQTSGLSTPHPDNPTGQTDAHFTQSYLSCTPHYPHHLTLMPWCKPSRQLYFLHLHHRNTPGTVPESRVINFRPKSTEQSSQRWLYFCVNSCHLRLTGCVWITAPCDWCRLFRQPLCRHWRLLPLATQVKNSREC